MSVVHAMATDEESIESLDARQEALSQKIRDARLGQRGALRSEIEVVGAERKTIVDRLRAELATKNGWRFSERSFSLDELASQARRYRLSGFGGLIDHPECFRDPTRPYRPRALLSHTYNYKRIYVAGYSARRYHAPHYIVEKK